mmetsp:Transcript_52397/g.131695  ORF Transcript_52397/g.131695 Transcript_52397/m.131695 type:complete len:797 (+) Transcript_52397:19-2409(+)
MPELMLKVRPGTELVYKHMNFDTAMTVSDALRSIGQRSELPGQPSECCLFVRPNSTHSGQWLENTCQLSQTGLAEREAVEVKLKPHPVQFYILDQIVDWNTFFSLNIEDRLKLDTVLVDYHDPLLEIIPVLESLMLKKGRDQRICYLFQHLVVESTGHVKTSWININISLVDQEIPPGANIVLFPLTLLFCSIDLLDGVTKQGVLMKASLKDSRQTGVKKRHVLLKDFCLFYAESRNGTPNGIIPLEYYTIELDKSKFVLQPCKFPILKEVTYMASPTVTYSFKADTEAEAREWYKLIRPMSAMHAGSRVFGVSIEKVVFRKGSKSLVPGIVTRCLNYFERNGVGYEGLFRISPSNNSLDSLKESLDSGSDTEFDGQDPHLVAGLLKQYLRELPEPLVPFTLFAPLVELFERKEADRVVLDNLRRLFSMVSPPCQATLKRLLAFIKDVSLRSDQNKMSLPNLATCFGPTLLRPKEDSYASLQQTPLVLKIMEFLITNSHLIFCEEPVFNRSNPQPVDLTTPSAASADQQRAGRIELPGMVGFKLPSANLSGKPPQLPSTAAPRPMPPKNAVSPRTVVSPRGQSVSVGPSNIISPRGRPDPPTERPERPGAVSPPGGRPGAVSPPISRPKWNAPVLTPSGPRQGASSGCAASIGPDGGWKAARNRGVSNPEAAEECVVQQKTAGMASLPPGPAGWTSGKLDAPPPPVHDAPRVEVSPATSGGWTPVKPAAAPIPAAPAAPPAFLNLDEVGPYVAALECRVAESSVQMLQLERRLDEEIAARQALEAMVRDLLASRST